ncbi:MAG: 50S ribosomal protein L30e [Candidatus Anstonellales archaeon]
MAVDIAKQIRMCVETGKVGFGEREAIKASLLGSAKMIIISKNIKPQIKSDLEHNAKISNIPIVTFDGNGYELGSVCGVPYTVSAISIFDEGNSEIVSTIKKKKD